MAYSSSEPATVAAYFGTDVIRDTAIITAEFTPGEGWKRYPSYRKHITTTYAGKLRRAGVTAVELRVGDRVADFQISELTR